MYALLVNSNIPMVCQNQKKESIINFESTTVMMCKCLLSPHSLVSLSLFCFVHFNLVQTSKNYFITVTEQQVVVVSPTV